MAREEDDDDDEEQMVRSEAVRRRRAGGGRQQDGKSAPSAADNDSESAAASSGDIAQARDRRVLSRCSSRRAFSLLVGCCHVVGRSPTAPWTTPNGRGRPHTIVTSYYPMRIWFSMCQTQAVTEVPARPMAQHLDRISLSLSLSLTESREQATLCYRLSSLTCRVRSSSSSRLLAPGRTSVSCRAAPQGPRTTCESRAALACGGTPSAATAFASSWCTLLRAAHNSWHGRQRSSMAWFSIPHTPPPCRSTWPSTVCQNP